ncbi:hypothetical protein RB653_008515 [Dictyostelium firmibasis]|uniref:DNA-directed RNA polymerase III subunit n=1 Tax=Dictyostelium firmibasis TaxID=79012 RepID=A0AAN7YU23_9MYCE
MFKQQSNGGVDSLKKRDRDEDEETNDKKSKLSFEIPKPIYPPRKDIPLLPTIDIHNYTMLTTVIKIKQNIPFSIYNLNQKSSKDEDGVERYSNRFTKVKEKTTSIELKLPGIKYGYFPYDLTVNKKKPKKRALINTKTLDGLQKEEEEGKEGENEEEEEEEEDEEEEEEGDYGEDLGVDDDEDMDDPDEGGDGELDF